MMPRNRGSQSTGLVWRRSSHSNTQGNQCVEVALCDGRIVLRDLKDPDGPVLTFSRAEWREFVRRLGRRWTVTPTGAGRGDRPRRAVAGRPPTTAPSASGT